MNSFLYRIRSAVARYMYGRNGMDQLGWATFIAEFVLTVVANLSHNYAVYILLRTMAFTLTLLLFYRLLSRNLVKRRAENAKFLRWWYALRTGFRDVRDRHADKAHKYVKCSCGAWCRVPKGVGKVELMCPKCGGKKIVKT